MKPAKYNLVIYQGSTFKKTFIWKTGTKHNMLPVNITEIDFRMQIRTTPQSNTVIIELSTDNGGIIKTDSANGEFELNISSTDTTLFTFNKAVYDIEVTYPNGEVHRLFEGGVYLKLEVTKDTE
jgi:hypothetical protein